MRKQLVSAVAALAVCTAVLPSIADARGFRGGGGYGFHGGYGGGYGHGYGGYYRGGGFYYPDAFIGFGYGYYGYGAGYYAPDYYGAGPVAGYAPAIWYYCPPAQAYFPTVQACPVAWQAVAVQQAPQPVAQSNPGPTPVAAIPSGLKSFNLGDVLFDTDEATLLPAATWALDQLVAAAKKSPEGHLHIDGYTDNVGKDRDNWQLSQRRADAVKQYLVAHGIAPERMDATGHGDAGPIANNGTPAGRQQNRRVDVTFG